MIANSDVRPRARGRTLLAWAGMLVLGSTLAAQEGEWPYFGGDRTFKRYSPLDQIDASNVGDLRIVWRRPGLEPELKEEFPELRPGSNLRSTPIMVEGRLFLTNLVGLLRAVDPASGETVWSQAPFEPIIEEARGLSPRGVDLWTGGEQQRVFLARGNYLYSVDASSGDLDGDFGDQGRVSLRLPGPLAGDFTWTAGPIVVGDVVVVAGFTGGAGDGGNKREATPEDVRGYDVRTGRRLWTFHVVPRPGEPGNETWGEGSWEYSGDLGSWCCLTADEELGYVYVQLSAPTAAYYGGHRPGDNLYSNALVALNAKTGERIWHFQMVRHDVWEWDTVGPATLGEITVDGRRIDAVIQPSKTGFLYVFDRRTGEPVWPIEERAVPGSRVPGERLSPTQPFPTKPPPFDRQGFVEDDLIDFTPELRARALELVKPFRLGPIFTPPGLLDDEQGKIGTLTNPGAWGTGNWHTGAFDPETGIYYAVSHTWPGVYSLTQPEDSDATLGYVMGYDAPDVPTLDGLPIVKPPYGRITAIDLHRGEHVWMAANGDGPRDHPLLEGLDVPPLGVAGRPAPLLTKTLLFIGEGSDAIPGIEGEEGPLLGQEVPRLRQGDGRGGMGDGAAIRYHRCADNLLARGPPVHRRRGRRQRVPGGIRGVRSPPMMRRVLIILCATVLGSSMMAANDETARPAKISKPELGGKIFERPDVVEQTHADGHVTQTATSLVSSDQSFSSGMYRSGKTRIEITQPYGVDEFMYFLEGGVTLTSSDGTELVINAGEAVTVPKEWTGVFETDGYTKIWVIYSPRE